MKRRVLWVILLMLCLIKTSLIYGEGKVWVRDSAKFTADSLQLASEEWRREVFGSKIPGANGENSAQREQMNDKKAHFLMGMAVATSISGFKYAVDGKHSYSGEPEESALLGVTAALVTGIVKEIIDFYGNGTPEFADFTANAAGGGVAGIFNLAYMDFTSKRMPATKTSGLVLGVTGVVFGFSALKEMGWFSRKTDAKKVPGQDKK